MIYDHPFIRLVYRHSPVFAQHVLVSAYGLLQMGERRSAAFRRYAAELEQSQWLAPGELAALQEARLAALVRHAYDNVPYYRRLFDERKLKPADIRQPGDLYKLPVLTRQELHRHQADLRARNIPARQAVAGISGGTTGDVVHFNLDHQRITFDHALTLQQWAWAGYHPGDRLVMIRGFQRAFGRGSQEVYWRYDRLSNRYFVSNIHFSREHLPHLLAKLREWRPSYLFGFPSTLFVLARYLESCDTVLPLQAVFTSSEVLPDSARQIMEQRFACRVWDRYGNAERLVVGQQCEHRRYHQRVEYGLLQIDWPRGQPAPPGAKGELIHTGLTNFSMPLIRYASEDLGGVLAAPCPCGRGLPLMGRVDGRRGDVIVCADGRLLTDAAFNEYHGAVPRAERVQLVQRRVGEVVMRVLPRPGFTQADRLALIRLLGGILGPGNDIRLEVVDDLQLTPSGKNRFVVSEVDLEEVTGLALRMA